MSTSETQSIHIYTDGACFGDPGPAGAAALLVSTQQYGIKATRPKENKDHQKNNTQEHSRSLFIGSKSTNNIAELEAIGLGLDLLEAFLVQQDSFPSVATIFSDSQYAINVLNGSWKAKLNVELVEKLQRKIQHVQASIAIQFEWVKAHAGNYYNERVDRMAKRRHQSVIGFDKYNQDIFSLYVKQFHFFKQLF